MLEIRNISKKYSGGATRYALHNVNLNLAPGEILAIVGPNGAGKSTLANVLVEDASTEGSILLDGVDVTRWPAYARSSQFARLTQDPSANLSDAISIGEHFVLAKSRARRRSSWFGISAEIRQEARSRLSVLKCGLEERLDDPATQLSGGERQLVALSLLMVAPPKVLILDEPTSALDLAARARLHSAALEMVRRHCLTTIWITHDLDEALLVGTRVILMANGKIAHDFSGHARAMLTRERVAELISQLILRTIVPGRGNAGAAVGGEISAM